MTTDSDTETEISLQEDDDTFVTLKDYPKYEIDFKYPYNIRKKGQNGFIKESVNAGGYVIVHLYGETCYKHRIIAQQFLPNPEGFSCVDHKNHNRSDNHLSNIRWVSCAENARNLSSKRGINYEFVDELEANAFKINFINDYEFEDYWLDGNKIVYYNGVRYRILIKHAYGNQWRILMRDVNGESRSVSKYQLEEAMSNEYEKDFNIE